MNERRDLGVTLLAAMLLLLIMSHMTQCSSAARRPSGVPAVVSPASTVAGREPAEGARSPGAGREKRGKEDEESERVKAIGHALQTIGANPTMAATYGFRP